MFGGPDDDIAYHSRYVRVRPLADRGIPLSVVEQIVTVSRSMPVKPVLYVTGDYWLSCVSRHEDLLQPYVKMVLPPAASVTAVVDKKRFQEYSETPWVSVPMTWGPRTESELRDLLPDLPLPLVIKPHHSYQWQEPEFVKNYGQRKMFLARSPQDLLRQWLELQEFGYRW